MLEPEPFQDPHARGPSLLLRHVEIGDGRTPIVPNDNDEASRRSSPRRRVLRRGLIVHRGGFCTLGCTILNLSETGALLMPADMALFLSTFVLKPQDGPSRHCEVVWRKRETIGVRFL